MRIGIIGAGAIGTWAAVRCATAGHRVSVLARGETLRAAREKGLTLEDGNETIAAAVAASDIPSELGLHDVVIIAVKTQSVPEVAPAAAAMLDERAIVVPMLNGVPWWFMGPRASLPSLDPDGIIAASIPYGSIISCVVHAPASQVAPGHVRLHRSDQLIFGEPGGGTSGRLTHLVELFARAGLPAHASASIRQDIWYKLWGNMTVNPISALTLATADRILADPLVMAMVAAVMEEAREIGYRIGCPIAETVEERNAVTARLGAFRTSMLQDLDAGRALELGALLGAPREIAAGLAVPTPFIDALLGLTRLMAQSRGLR